MLVPAHGSLQNNDSCQVSISVESPSVILQSGTSGNATISTNSTNACVSVSAPVSNISYSSFDYVVEVVNQASSSWNVSLEVYDSSNVSRLSNCTISFHDHGGQVSDEVVVNSGVITQSVGPQYILSSESTIYISMSNVQAAVSGTSYLYVYVKVFPSNPDVSPFNVFKIAFEVT
jgi:hypothetical protein